MTVWMYETYKVKFSYVLDAMWSLCTIAMLAVRMQEDFMLDNFKYFPTR